jgi:RNA-directed DNA polymerase
VLDADIEACFGRIDNAVLMGRARSRVKGKCVLALMKAFLTAGVLTEQAWLQTPTPTPLRWHPVVPAGQHRLDRAGPARHGT